MRDLRSIVQNAYSPAGQMAYGSAPSGNYASGAMPDYFSRKERARKGAALFNGGLSGLSGAMSFVAPELAPWTVPISALSGTTGLVEYGESKRFGKAADMWSRTGLPQNPAPLADGTIDPELLDALLQQMQGGR